MTTPRTPTGPVAPDPGPVGQTELGEEILGKGSSPSSPRAWTVELPAGFPLVNANRRLHHMAKARLVRNLRVAALVCAKGARIPPLARAHIVCEYRPPDRRVRDVHNLYPSAKAADDGLVDADVLPDDADAYLVGPDMRLGAVERGGRLVLHITELQGAPE